MSELTPQQEREYVEAHGVCSVHGLPLSKTPWWGYADNRHKRGWEFETEDEAIHAAYLFTLERLRQIAALKTELSAAQATIAALKTELSAAQAAIAALQWTEITPDNLPKPLVHEVLDPVRGFVGTVFASWPYGRSIEAGWFYFRPISPPAQASATDLDAVAAEQQAELAEKAEWMRRTAVYEDSPRSTGGGTAERTRR